MPNNHPPDHAARCRICEDLDTTMLVEAAAGTGKTTSMVGRMVALLREGKCEIDTLAAVTFTRKAAAEMRARFQVVLERSAREESGLAKQRLADAVARIERCFIGTIHSFCARLLRERPIEAGVDLAFEELDPEVDTLLREQAWDEYVAELFACDAPMFGQLRDLGLEINELRSAFAVFATYPDIEQWPAPVVELGDLNFVVGELREYVHHMEQLVPTFPHERGNDALMDKYETICRLVRHMNIERPVDLMHVLERFTAHGAVLYQWPGGAEQGEQERDRWEDFRTRVAVPQVERWREKRYPVVMSVFAEARSRYDQLRKTRGALNYQDLLLEAAALLRDKPAVRDYFRRRFSHLCVDEFQDTDPIQAQVMMYLTADNAQETEWRRCRPVPGALFVVGDPKQSIYRFRRADIATYNQVRTIIEQCGAIVPLTANFRTIADLVDWGNDIFEKTFPAAASAHQAAHQPLLVGREGDSDGELAGIRTLTIPRECRNADSIEWEADRIANFIRDALDRGLTVPRTERELALGVPRKVQPGDFLIVARNKWNLACYAQKLQQLGIPHEVKGGAALGAVRELALLVKCLAALVEPDNAVALVAVLRSEVFGFSDEALYAYRVADGRFSFRATIPPEAPAEVAEQFADAYERLQRYASWLNRLPPISAIERIAGDLGLLAQAAVSEGGNVQAGVLSKVIEHLRAAQAELHSPADLLEHLQDLIERDVEFDGLPVRPHGRAAVRIMNLHKAKGLEAPIVFLADATGKKKHDLKLHVDRSGDYATGYLTICGPKRGNQAPPVIARPPQWSRHAENESAFCDAEEKRLLYVAATRAGTQLTIVKRDTHEHSNHWQFFKDFTVDCHELSAPASQPPLAECPVDLDITEVSAAIEAVADRWRTAQCRSYATAAAKEISVTPSRLHHGGGSGEHGTEWGTVIHFLLEAVMRAPHADCEALARMALAEQGLDPTRAAAAVRVVQQVTSSELWQRASSSQRKLVEVPFVTNVTDPANAGDPPCVLRGVIDLVFRENDEWVVVDYKTDAVTQERLPELVQHYRRQVETYGSTWSAMLGEPVKEQGLYFTYLGRYVAL